MRHANPMQRFQYKRGELTVKKSHELDMTCGSLMPKMLAFAVPVILSGLLQLLFNAADLVVVGRFAGSDALAQVGATGAITRLIVNLFVGMSVGANVVMAHSYGAKDAEGISDTVHTTMLFALLGGLYRSAEALGQSVDSVEFVFVGFKKIQIRGHGRGKIILNSVKTRINQK